MEYVAPIVLVPFFGWGIFTLNRRYRHQEELSPVLEIITLLALLLFYAFEIVQLRPWMQNQVLAYLFTVLGLFVAGAALYGHVAISLTSRLIVDLMVPADEGPADRPRFGPAEILERRGDYDGALQEYLVLARIYPGNPQVHTRIAECYLALDRPVDAVAWFDRAVKNLKTDDKCLPVVTRLCEVYERVLREPESAREVLEAYLDRFPDTTHAALLRARLARIGVKDVQAPVSAALQKLEEAPLLSRASRIKRPRLNKPHLVTPDTTPAPVRKTEPVLEALDALPVAEVSIAPADIEETAAGVVQSTADRPREPQLSVEPVDSPLDVEAADETAQADAKKDEKGPTSTSLEPM